MGKSENGVLRPEFDRSLKLEFHGSRITHGLRGGIKLAFMEWDDSFSVNVAEIDEQHKKLIEMVNTFNDSIIDDKKAAFGDLLSSLVGYAVYHFTTEEEYMDKFNYPDTEAHKREHELFAAKALDVKKRFEDGSLVISLEITGFLKDWIANHVLGTDKKYSQCFNNHGLR